jgi:hypothetical protein
MGVGCDLFRGRTLGHHERHHESVFYFDATAAGDGTGTCAGGSGTPPSSDWTTFAYSGSAFTGTAVQGVSFYAQPSTSPDGGEGPFHIHDFRRRGEWERELWHPLLATVHDLARSPDGVGGPQFHHR